MAAYIEDSQDEENSLVAIKAEIQLPAKEWVSYKKFLMQRFPVVKLVSISSVCPCFELNVSSTYYIYNFSLLNSIPFANLFHPQKSLILFIVV